MVNTLRVTSVLAAGLAIALISFSAVYGFRSETNVEELLETPTVLEQLDQGQDTRPQVKSTQESPLVAQAKKFALHLDPPAAAVSRPRIGSGGSITVRPVTPPALPAKFQVVGISHHQDPNLSRALISETGADPRWICLDDKIGHHTVAAIKESGITLSNKQEVHLIPRPKISLVLGDGDASAPRGARPAAQAPMSSATHARYASPQPGIPRSIRSRTGVSPVRATTPRQAPLSDKDTEAMQKLVQKLHSFKRNGEELSAADERARQEIVNKLKAVHSQRLSRREADSLDTMGNRLDPNAAPGSTPASASN